MAAKFQCEPEREKSPRAPSARLSSRSVLVVLFVCLGVSTNNVDAGGDKGDDIILAKGKIIMRGGKGKGNIILDPGHHGGEEHHSMMAPMMFNPYAFYPMHHQQQQHQPQPAQMMIHPVYVEDHSAMHQHHKQEEHHGHEEPHYEHHSQQQHHEPEYHHHEPMMGHHHHEHEQEHEHEHHEPEMGHHQHHYEHGEHHEMPHEHHEHEHEHEQHHEEPMHHHHMEHHGGHYEHGGHESAQQHPLMAMMMHGSGLQPAYQQVAALQAMNQPAGVYMQPVLGPTNEQAVAYHQAQIAAAAAASAANGKGSTTGGHSNENGGELKEAGSSSQQMADANQAATNAANGGQGNASPSKSSTKFSLLEKSAKSPFVQMIKPLFRRHKNSNDLKDASSTKDSKASAA